MKNQAGKPSWIMGNLTVLGRRLLIDQTCSLGQNLFLSPFIPSSRSLPPLPPHFSFSLDMVSLYVAQASLSLYVNSPASASHVSELQVSNMSGWFGQEL